MGLVEEVENSNLGENEGGTRELESNFVDEGKSPPKSCPNSSNSSSLRFSKHPQF